MLNNKINNAQGLIGFISATKYYKTSHGLHVILENANFVIEPEQKIGILGSPGSGKTTLVKILAGIKKLNRGFVIPQTVWPLGYVGAFHPYLSASENLKIIAQLNYLDPLALKLFCKDFIGLSSKELNAKMQTYPASLRSKLGFALSFMMPCNFLLADEKISVGDEEFRLKCEIAVETKLKNTGLIYFSGNSKLTQKICNSHAVLHQGQITLFGSHEEASSFYDQSVNASETLQLGMDV